MPEEMIEELKKDKEKTKAGITGIEIAARIIRECRPYCQGIHIMALGWRTRCRNCCVRRDSEQMRPYQIAVCEDNDPERAELCGACREILEQSGTEYAITEFSSAEELYERLKEHPDAWDLLFLDIRMGNMSGMELARRIRREGNPVKLVFVTGDEGFALEGYGVQPLHYLMKPVDRKALEEAIRRALEEQQEQEKLILRNGSRTTS